MGGRVVAEVHPQEMARTRGTLEKYNHIVLDLDNTLIHSVKAKSASPRSLTRDDLQWFVNGSYVTFIRPWVKMFINYIYENFAKVSVWTAAEAEYATKIVNSIFDPDQKLHLFLTREFCEASSEATGTSKNLEWLQKNFTSANISNDLMIIVDDLNEVYETQPANCINIIGWYVTEPDAAQDRELLKIIQWFTDSQNTSKSLYGGAGKPPLDLEITPTLDYL